jgi:hypothetical protein
MCLPKTNIKRKYFIEIENGKDIIHMILIMYKNNYYNKVYFKARCYT